MYQTVDITEEVEVLLTIGEDHFDELHSKEIAPNKLQETFAAFANADGGNIYAGIEDSVSGGEPILIALELGTPE